MSISLRVILTVVLLAASAVNVTGAQHSPLDSLLRALDKTIDDKHAFQSERRTKIEMSTRDLSSADSDEDRYNIYRALYGLYRSFNGDSAMMVAEKRLEIAERLKDNNKIISATINLAESYTKAADHYHALRMLDALPRHLMEPYHLKYMYQVYTATYRRMAVSDGVHSHRLAFENKVRMYRDSTMALCDKSTTEYLTLQAAQLMGVGHWSRAKSLMAEVEKRDASAINAGMKTQMAIICRNLNEKDDEIRYLTEASILDLRNGVCDYVALMELAKRLNENGDSERAYNYIRCALDDAYFCNARSRAYEILELIPIIDTTYHDSEKSRANTLKTAFVIVMTLLLALALALWGMAKQLSANKHNRDKIDRQNERLSIANSHLKNASLLREKLISELFDTHSSYINRMSEFKKNVIRLMKASQYHTVLDLAVSDKTDSDELKELYTRFDAIYLTMYPTFIADFNAMLKPECRVQENATSLSSEFRVVALMKIGITGSSQIAKLLHYTTQTVYNYKSYIRNALIVPKEAFQAFLSSESL